MIRGRLVILSDFLDDTKTIMDALGRLQHRRFEILLMQLLDPHERELPAGGTARYVDMETGETIRVDPAELRNNYKNRMEASIRELAYSASQRQMDYHLINTENPYHSAIESYLGLNKRQGLLL